MFKTKKIFINVLIISSVVFSNISKANIIRDSEIEETLAAVVKPIALSANIRDLKIYLIQDESLNAFTDGGNRIYIFSGILTQFSNLDLTRGVIAHEIGHIVGKHIVRSRENIDTYSKAALSSIAVGLITATLFSQTNSQNSDTLGKAAIATVIGGQHIAERAIMSYSRSYESSADQAAFKLLEKNGYSVKGMLEFFTYLSKQPKSLLINPYDQTHPLSQERITAIKDYYQKSKFKISKDYPDLDYKFQRSIAKLRAFTTKEPKKYLDYSDPEFNAEINNYIKAICYFRTGDLNNAISKINELISLRPFDPFYHELKGQIFFEFGRKEALDSYNTALKLRPNDILIKLSRAIVGITINFNNISVLKQFYKDLKFVSDLEPDNITALYYLSLYYDKIQDKPRSMLYTAIIALKSGDNSRAIALAKQAVKGLTKETPDWYKAQDIIFTEKSPN